MAGALPEGYTVRKDVLYKESGGWKGFMDLYLPAPGIAPVPIVITLHGGAWRHGSRDQLREYEFYATQGYAVANVDYRLSKEALAPAAVEDVRCSLLYLVRNAAELNIDPQRILLYGGSAGGHLALMAGLLGSNTSFDVDCETAEDFRIAGIISKSGVSLLYATEADGSESVLKDGAVYEWFGNKKNDVQFAKALSPISYVTAESPPVLLIHGDADQRVSYSQSEQMAARLTAFGIFHVFHTVSGAGHASRPEDKDPIRKVLLAFLEKVLPPAHEHHLPKVEIVNVLEPAGESNVRSSFRLSEGQGLIGTEETGDIFKTVDGGLTWRKVFDGGDEWDIADVRNFIRAGDGYIYITTTEPGLVARSTDEGKSWEILTRAPASRTVGLVELDNGVILVGLRRSENGKTSILRSGDHFESCEWLPVSENEPRQNVTCFGYWGGPEVLAGVGFEGSGKVYKSTDYGKTWTLQAEFPEARDLMGFYRTGDDIRVLASGIATLYKSSDGGNTWSAEHQFWPKGFLGQCVPYARNGHSYLLMAATDQSSEMYRHLVLISSDAGATWQEWIDLAREAKGMVKGSNESGGGASNICVLSPDTVVVGVGNHAVQGRAYSLKVSD